MIRTVKLMACTMCGDVVRLNRPIRWCRCHNSVGRQTSVKKVEVAGPCVVLGLSKEDFDSVLTGAAQKRKMSWYYIPSGDEVTSTNAGEFEGSEQ